MRMELWQAFVLGAVVSWGVYITVLHEGQARLGGGTPSAGSLRAFLCVGLAYLLTAVVIPVALLSMDLAAGERLDFTRDGRLNIGGLAFAIGGGIAGATGALCIILSIKNGGKPLYIAPLVFAGAPIMNAIVSLLWHPPEGARDPKGWIIFGAGILLACLGAALVLYAKGSIEQQSKESRMRQKAPAVAQASPEARTR